MTFLKQKILNRQITIYHDNDLIAELNIEKFEVTMGIKFSHPVGTHNDMLWALALAVYATKEPSGKH